MQQRILVVLIALEVALFSITGRNFFTAGNFFECIRLSVELGLLSLALTPVIVTGGIDLSVGSMMGLCAVLLGSLWQDHHLPLALAASITLLVSLLGGLVNGLLIARLRVSPLIVTLGSYSLFRGLAEGITGAAKNYSGFPGWFTFWGQGYALGAIPPQTLVFVVTILFFGLLLHRTPAGRSFFAIGHAQEGARYAGIPVAQRTTLVYVLSGLSAGVAALIYVAHLGQAKSDAGTGYELTAITAVVLGGTSIFGGEGTIGGTLLGLAAIVTLQNGLRLSAWPTELTGVLTGLLLLVTIALDRFTARRRLARLTDAPSSHRRQWVMVSAAALLLIVFGGFARNWTAGGGQRQIVIGAMPKAKGDPYFISCRTGAEEAAKDLKAQLIWDGPTGLDAAKQNEIVEGWITRGVDAIAVAVENGPGISSVLRKARARGIKVVTWDADAEPDARDYFVNQATPRSIGYTLTDEAARVMHEQGDVAVVTGALSAANQNQWISFIRERLQTKYPRMKLTLIRPSDDDRDKAFSETQTILRVYPRVRVVIVISAPAVPGAGEAVKQSSRKDVTVVGLSLPNLCKPYVHDGSVEAVVLWKTHDLGYAAVSAAAALAEGKLKTSGTSSFDVPTLGKLRIEKGDIILGEPFIFRKDNIDHFSF